MDFKTKKELKKHINENGRFIQMSLNVITKEKAKIPKEYENSIPEWAFYFKGIASNGELNRNWYIIRSNAWKWTIDTFLEVWTVLYQHNPEKPIGKPLSAKVKGNELIVEWFAYDDTYSEGNIWRGLVTGLSTGHITEECEFQHKETEKVISEEEFDKLLQKADTFSEWVEILNTWILCVTKADLVEFSFVSLPSNKWSKITQKNAIMAHLGVDSEEDLESKFNDMKKLITNEVKVETNEEIIEEEKKEEEVVEDKVEEKAEETKEEATTEQKDKTEEVTEEVVEETNEIEKEVEEVVEDVVEEKEEVVEVKEVPEEKEDLENGGETPSTEVEVPENGEEAPEENLENNMEKVIEANNVKFNEKLEENTTSLNSKIEKLENSLKEKSEEMKMLTEAVDLIAKMAMKTNENLGNLIVNGVSSFKKEEKEVQKSSLTTILEWLKA